MAHDVADGDADRPVRQGEQVIPVAADLRVRAAGEVPGGAADPGQPGQGRQQRSLQADRHLQLPGVHSPVDVRPPQETQQQRRLPGERGRRPPRPGAERPRPVRVEVQPADGPPGVVQRQGQARPRTGRGQARPARVGAEVLNGDRIVSAHRVHARAPTLPVLRTVEGADPGVAGRQRGRRSVVEEAHAGPVAAGHAMPRQPGHIVERPGQFPVQRVHTRHVAHLQMHLPGTGRPLQGNRHRAPSTPPTGRLTAQPDLHPTSQRPKRPRTTWPPPGLSASRDGVARPCSRPAAVGNLTPMLHPVP